MDAVIGAGRTSKIVCPVGSRYEMVLPPSSSSSSSALLIRDAVVVVVVVVSIDLVLVVPPHVTLTVDTVLVVVVRWPGGTCGGDDSTTGTGKTETAGTGNGSMVVVGLKACGYAPGKTTVPCGYVVKV